MYVSKQWNVCGIEQHLFPPEYLIRMMLRFLFPTEYVHLLDMSCNGDHYKMNVFDIFAV